MRPFGLDDVGVGKTINSFVKGGCNYSGVRMQAIRTSRGIITIGIVGWLCEVREGRRRMSTRLDGGP